MKISLILAAALVFGGYSVSTIAQTAAQTDQQVTENLAVQKATSDKLSLQFAPIHSAVDVNKSLIAKVTGTPLDKLSPGAKQRFLDSLTFNENGITGFSYADLERELSASDVYQVLSLFGVQRLAPMVRGSRVETQTDSLIKATPMATCGPGGVTTGPGTGCDHEGYRCEGRATCMSQMSAICTQNC